MHLLALLAAAASLPGFSPAAAGPDGGHLLQGVFPGTVRPGLVYLPPGFERSRRYPVVYLLHGLPGAPTEYTGGADLAGFADPAIAGGRLAPFIAVLPAAGTTPAYDGEWAGPWETALVDDVIPFVDANLPTEASARGRVIAGLSAGGFGAFDIALRHPALFGAAESWSGYFTPLHDGPFKHASKAVLRANDPALLAAGEAPALRRAGVRFFVSTGPYHSHWIPRGTSQAFVARLRALRLPVAFHVVRRRRGEWREQLAAGLAWAFPPRPAAAR